MLRLWPLLFFMSAGAAQELRVEEVGPGVYAVLQPQEDRFNDSNAVFIFRATDVDLAPFRKALAGTDPVALGAFDDFIPATVEQAWEELRKP